MMAGFEMIISGIAVIHQMHLKHKVIKSTSPASLMGIENQVGVFAAGAA